MKYYFKGSNALLVKLFGLICLTRARKVTNHDGYPLLRLQDEGENSKEDLRELALNEHNKLRNEHGVPDLKQDEQLNKIAQKYAEHLASTDNFDHSTDNEFGENLMITTAEDEHESVQIAVSSWYEEIEDYNFKNPGYAEKTAHFTEMIWKTNTHMGVGIAWNSKQSQYVIVANYKPGGNVDEQYEENVPPRQ